MRELFSPLYGYDYRQNAQRLVEMMEDIRQVLIDRIDQLDWMSEATKQEAAHHHCK